MVKIAGIDTLLKEHPFFEGMEPNSQKVLAGCAANERIAAGEVIFREGDPATKMYLVRHGTVSLEIHAPGRDVVVLETVGEGEMFGWSALVPPHSWAFDARAVSLCRLISLDSVCLRGKTESDHSLGFDLLSRVVPVMSSRLWAARMRLIDMYGNPSGSGS